MGVYRVGERCGCPDHRQLPRRDGSRCSASPGSWPAAFGAVDFLGGYRTTTTLGRLRLAADVKLDFRFLADAALGATTIFGAVVGAMFYGIARPLAESVTNDLGLLDALSSAQKALLVLAVLVIAFMLVEPTGLRGVWLPVRRYFATWPFRY